MKNVAVIISVTLIPIIMGSVFAPKMVEWATESFLQSYSEVLAEQNHELESEEYPAAIYTGSDLDEFYRIEASGVFLPLVGETPAYASDDASMQAITLKQGDYFRMRIKLTELLPREEVAIVRLAAPECLLPTSITGVRMDDFTMNPDGSYGVFEAKDPEDGVMVEWKLVDVPNGSTQYVSLPISVILKTDDGLEATAEYYVVTLSDHAYSATKVMTWLSLSTIDFVILLALYQLLHRESQVRE